MTVSIRDAKPIPYLGAYYANDFRGTSFELEKYPTKIVGLDSLFEVFMGGLIVITGTPTTGKSLFVQHLCFQLAYHHDLKSVIGTFENPPPQVINEIQKMYVNKDRVPKELFNASYDWVNEHIHFIVADAPEISVDDVPDKTDLAWFMDAAATFIIREGVKVVVIDPWNELEHSRDRHELMTEYVARMIRELKRFARRFNVAVIIVAHPTKLEYDKKEKTFRKPTLYDIAQSAAWYDKPDIGIVLHRPGRTMKLDVDVQKVRFREAGTMGLSSISWNVSAFRYDIWERFE